VTIPAIVVAASDSSKSVKNGADYVCDGSADDVQIQAAIDSLPSFGGEVVCASGNYVIKETVVVPSNVTLRFMPGNTVKVEGTVPADWTLTPVIYRTADVRCLFRNENAGNGTSTVDSFVRIIGAQCDLESPLGENTKYDGFYGVAGDADNTVWAAIWLDQCLNSSIEDCAGQNVLRSPTAGETDQTHQVNGRQFGLLMSYCQDSEILRSEGSAAGYEGIGIRGDNDGIIVRDCYGSGNCDHILQAAQWTSMDSDPAADGEYHDLVFEGIRTVGNVGQDDIAVHASDESGDVLITGCSVFYISLLGGPQNITVANNNLTYCEVIGGNTQAIRNILITGNNFRDGIESTNGRTEMAVQIKTGTDTAAAPGNGSFTGVTVSNNNFYECGIFVFSGSFSSVNLDTTTTLRDINIVGNNFFNETDHAVDYGQIYIKNYSTIDIERLIIKNNNFFMHDSAKEYAILMFLYDDGGIVGCDIGGNTGFCKEFLHYRGVGGPSGVFDQFRVYDNNIECSSSSGVFLRGDVTNDSYGSMEVFNNRVDTKFVTRFGGQIKIWRNQFIEQASWDTTASTDPTELRFWNNTNTTFPTNTLLTGTRTLRDYESGNAYNNLGASATTTYNLPAALVGLEYFISDVEGGEAMVIEGDGAEEIGSLGTQANSSAGNIGEIHIRCIVDGAWAVVTNDGWT